MIPAGTDDVAVASSNADLEIADNPIGDIGISFQPDFEGATHQMTGSSTSRRSVERGRRDTSAVSEGVSGLPSLNINTPGAGAKSNEPSINHGEELPAQSTSNIQQASAVELPPVWACEMFSM